MTMKITACILPRCTCAAATLSVLFSLAPVENATAQPCDFIWAPQNPCPGESVTFSVTNPQAGHVYSFVFSSPGPAPQKGNTVTATFPLSTSANTYTVTLLDSLGNQEICSLQHQVQVKAAPALVIDLAPQADVSFSNGIIATCNALPSGGLEIRIRNTTPAGLMGQNVLYTIDWGDGSSPETHTNATFNTAPPIPHTYTKQGSSPITITVQHQNGCTWTYHYEFYSGSNPSVGLGTPGQTINLCPPATLTFPVNTVQGNSPGTTYQFQVNGVTKQTFNQSNIPASITHTFTESSCGQGDTDNPNAYFVTIIAQNPCGRSEAKVGPITVSKAPVAVIGMTMPPSLCPGAEITFSNQSWGGAAVVQNPPGSGMFSCDSTTEQVEWMISPGINGIDFQYNPAAVFDQSITVRFLKTGTYTIKMNVLNQNSTCGVSMATKVITIAELPQAEADAEIFGSGDCAPKTIKFHNKSLNVTMPPNWKVNPSNGWSFIAPSSASSNDPTLIFTQAGTYTITLMVSNPCGMDSWDTTIVVKSAPVISLTLPAASICAPNTFSITPAMFAVSSNGGFADTDLTYNWSIQRPGNPPLTSTDKFPQNILFDQPGTYVFSVTVTNGCGPAIATASLTVGQSPDAAFAFTAPSDSCVGKTIAFTNQSVGTNLVYQPVNVQGPPGGAVFTTNMPTGFTINFQTAGTYTVSLTANNNCPMPNTDTYTATFVFYDKPNLQAFLVSAPCEGEPIVFPPANITLSTGNLPCTCTYSIPGVLSLTVPCNQASPPTVLPGNGPYTVTLTAANACGSAARTATFSPAKKPVPDFDLILPSPVCTPFTLQCTDLSQPFSANPFRQWMLLDAAGNTIATSAAASPGFPITAIGSYTVRLTLGNGCDTLMLEKPFTAYSAPVAQLTVGGNNPCGSGAPILTLNIQSDGGLPTTIQWNFPGGNPATGTGPQPTPPFYGQAGSYTITATVDNGVCPPATLQDNFNVTAIPQANVMLDPQPDCLPPTGQTIPLSLTSLVGVNYQWTVTRQNDGTTPANPFTLTNPNAATPNLSIHVCGIYTYTLTAWNACNTVTWSQTDTFFAAPAAVPPQFPDPFCQSAMLDLSGTSYQFGCDPTVSISWESPLGQVLSTAMHPQDIVFSSPSSVQTFTLYLLLDGQCGGDTLSTTITIDAPEALALGPVPLRLCKNDAAVALMASPGGGKWYLKGNEVPGGMVTPASLPADTYWFVYQKGSGACVSEDSIEVTIYDLPIVSAGADITVCVEAGQVTLTPSLPAGAVGQWTSSHPGVIILGDTATFGTVLNATLTFTATDTATGCTNDSTMTLSVIPNSPLAVPADISFCNTPGPLPLPLVGGNPMLQYSGPGITPDGRHFDPALPGTGPTNTLTWANTNAAGCVATGTLTVNLTPLLAPGVLDAGQPEVLCQNDGPYTRLGLPNTLQGLIWLDSLGVPVANSSTLTLDPSVFQQDVLLTFILSYGFGSPNCRQDDTTALYIQYAAPDAGPDLARCLDDPTFVLTPANAPPPGFVAYWTPSDTADPAAGTQVFVLHFESPYCLFSDTLTVTVNGLPGSAFNILAPYCEGVPLVFQNNTLPGAATSQAWYDNGVLFSTDGEPQGYVATPGLHTFRLVSSTAADCTDEFEIAIFIESPPVITAAPSTMEGCGPLPVTFSYTSQAADTLYFEVLANNMLLTSVAASGSPQTLLLPDGPSDLVYTVRLVSQNECFQTVLPFDILVRARTLAALSVNQDTLCNGQTLSVLSQSTNSVADTLIFEGVKYPTSITQLVQLPVANPGEQPIVRQLLLISYNPCNTDTATLDIVINPAEYEALAETNTDLNKVCTGDSVLLIGHATVGANTYWKNQAGTILLDSIVWVSAAEGPNEWVFYAEGCGTDSDTVKFIGKPAPDLDLYFLPDACIGAPHQIEVAGAGAEFRVVFAPGDTVTGAFIERTFLVPGVHPFRVTATSALTGCTTLLDTFVTVRPKPPIPVRLTEGCTTDLGFLLEITDSPGAEIFVWRDSVYSGTGAEHPRLPSGHYRIKLTEPQYGCSSDTAVFVPEVRPVAVQAYPELPDTLLLGESASLLAVGQYVVSYKWSQTAWLDDATSPEPVATPASLGCHLFVVTATDDRNCTARDTVELCVVKQRIHAVFPTAFTPNGDGTNDLLYPRTRTNTGILRMEFWVHDQWGELVFRAEDGCLPNDPSGGSCAWDGTFQSRQSAMANYRAHATFYYLDGTTDAFARVVRLIR